MKTAATVAIVMVALVIAAIGVYGMFNMNLMTQSKPNQVQVTNYSAAINSLKPQINSINNNISSLSSNMSSLGSVKSDISDINGKLSALENTINQTQQTATQSVIVLDRSSYFPGDIIHISASGLDPQATVNIQLVDNSGFVVMQRNTASDYAGKVSYDFPLSFTVATGNHEVRIVAGQKAVSQPITILSPSYSSSITSSSSLYPFTTQTSKGVYQAGDLIEIFGIGMPDTTVTSLLTSPSGRTFTSDTTAQADGSYALFFTDSSHETGSWQSTAYNQGLARTVYFTVTPNPPVISYSFTAQAFSSVYEVGDLVRVSGTAQPFTLVNAVLTSPSGVTYDATTTSSSSGSYIVSFSTASWYETGNWFITLTNQGETRVVSIFLQSGTPTPPPFTAQTDKTIYQKGDLIRVSGTVQPFTNVDTSLTSPSGSRYDSTTTATSDGSYVNYYTTLPTYESGNWFITITNQGQTRVISIFIESGSSSGGSNAFTLQTDKAIYNKGDVIKISGTAKPFSEVSAALTSPSGVTSNGATKANMDGSYNVSFSTMASYETGVWYITTTNQGQARVVSVFLN